MAVLIPDSRDPAPDSRSRAGPVCVLLFNANDPSGAGGLAGDAAAVGGIGGHGLPVVTGSYVRDSSEIHEHLAFDDDHVTEQARAVLEDMPVQAIKVGFAGSADNLAAIAAIAEDYAQVPVVTYMPDLSWWSSDAIDLYHDACAELLLPATSLLIGNHGTLWRWLLPDWQDEKPPGARDLAAAAAEHGVPYLLATGMLLPDGRQNNVLATPHAVLCSAAFDTLPGSFIGAGDTLSATVTALVACGCELTEAVQDALTYVEGCLACGFRPGMGHQLPDRMFWAEPDDDADPDEPDDDPFGIAPNDTPH